MDLNHKVGFVVTVLFNLILMMNRSVINKSYQYQLRIDPAITSIQGVNTDKVQIRHEPQLENEKI
jgi:hypothetical protein